MNREPEPCVINVEKMSVQNGNFRTTIWTGNCLQMTLMCIEPHDDIGVEIHENTDQMIRVEQGKAEVRIGNCRNRLDMRQYMEKGDVVFIPAGTWHNVINTEGAVLKLSSVYAPPNHPRGTVHRTKAEAMKAE